MNSIMDDQQPHFRLIGDDGQPHYGRFKHAPTVFNVADYHNNFLKSTFKRRLRYKKFSFVGIVHRHFNIGFAVVDVSWAGHGFYYVYDRQSCQVVEQHSTVPLARGMQLEEMGKRADFHYKHLSIAVRQQTQQRHITIKAGQQLLLEADIATENRHNQPLYLCSPNGVRGWTFTHKSMALPIKGRFNFHDRWHEFDATSLASLDDSCGFLRPETEWYWLSWQGWQTGRHTQQRIAVNIASGVNDSIDNENCLWLDGVLYALPHVIFKRLNATCWQIYSLDGAVNLQIMTAWRRHESVNLGLVASEFSQWVSTIHGQIAVEEQIVDIESDGALLEQHYAKW